MILAFSMEAWKKQFVYKKSMDKHKMAFKIKISPYKPIEGL
jgi:hypothetical protein